MMTADNPRPVRLDLTASDPLMGWLRRHASHRLGTEDPGLFRLAVRLASGLLFPLLLATVVAAPQYLSAMIEGNFLNPYIRTDLFHDLGAWNFVFLAFFLLPFSSGLYRRIESMFAGFLENGNIAIKESEYLKFIDKWNQRFASRTTRWLPVAASVIVTTYLKYTFDFKLVDTWHNPDGHGVTVAVWLGIPIVAFSLYMIFQFAWRVILICLMLLRAYRFAFRIQILHPDRCGGFASIGNLSLYLNLVVFCFGLVVALGCYNNTQVLGKSAFGLENILMVTSYVLASAFIVFAPVFPMHSHMVTAREKVLKGLNREFEKQNAVLTSCLESGRKLDEEATEQLEAIKLLHEIVTTQPVWPFNISLLYTFIGSVISPLAFFVLESYLGKFF